MEEGDKDFFLSFPNPAVHVLAGPHRISALHRPTATSTARVACCETGLFNTKYLFAGSQTPRLHSNFSRQ